jgi:NADP-dependent aldehyde dehydrogenase
MDLSGANLIGGEWVVGTGRPFQALNPATRAPVPPAFRESDRDAVDRACTAAAAAFEPFSQSPAADRARLLRAAADEIETLGATLIERATQETALGVARLESERLRTLTQLRMFATHIEEGSWVEARIDTADPARAPTPKPDVRRMLVPIGPVAVFGASNFPLAFSVAGGDTASALAAGCPVVCKAHPAHPGTSELVGGAVVRAARSCGVPGGVFSLLHGWSHEVGLAMVRHPAVRAVGFTGSLRGGRALFDAAAARPDPIPVYAEMGSVNPVFVLPSALADRPEEIARGLAQSITVGVGQFCTNPGVVLAARGPGLDEFRATLGRCIAETGVGDMLYPRLTEAYAEALDRARAGGAETLATAEATAGAGRACPTLLATDLARFVADAELRHEIFGPASLLVIGDDVSDLERAAAAMEGQLTATILGTDGDLGANAELVRHLAQKVGRLIFNGVPTGVEVGHAMQHGGPYPATTDSRATSVGTAAIARFARPICYQGFPDAALPSALRNRNALGIWRLVDGRLTKEDVA